MVSDICQWHESHFPEMYRPIYIVFFPPIYTGQEKVREKIEKTFVIYVQI